MNGWLEKAKEYSPNTTTTNFGNLHHFVKLSSNTEE